MYNNETGHRARKREKRGLRPILVTFHIISFNPHKRLHDVNIISPILQTRKQRLRAIKKPVTANKWQGWDEASQ